MAELGTSKEVPTAAGLIAPLVLNQYRHTSSYKDTIGQRYHFPNRYLRSFSHLPVQFVYYEPREGGEQVYFGAGVVRSVLPDTEDSDHSYADIDSYQTFPRPLSFYAGPTGQSWEPAKTMRNSVRRISDELYRTILATADVRPVLPGDADPSLYEKRLETAWEGLRGREDALALRKKRRVLESYERPSWVTNAVKRQRGNACQLCGVRGFIKKDGDRYCEIHHLFHLSDNPPDECLGPEFVVVLCATCHRRMHYADVSVPVRVPGGWRIVVDGRETTLPMPD